MSCSSKGGIGSCVCVGYLDSRFQADRLYPLPGNLSDRLIPTINRSFSFSGVLLSPQCPFLARRGCTFRELANYEYDYLGRALDGKPDLSQRCHLTSSLSSMVSTLLGPLVLFSHPDLTRDVTSRNRISRIIGPRQVFAFLSIVSPIIYLTNILS